MIVIVGELNKWGKSDDAMNQIKTMITSTLTKKELKCIDAIMVKDFRNFFFFSNYELCLPPEGKNDRRMNNLQAGCKYCKGSMDSQEHLEFWTFIHTLMGSRLKNGETLEYTEEQKQTQDRVREHFFHYIMTFNLNGFNPEDIIKTEDRVLGEESRVPKMIKWFRCLFYKCDEEGWRNYPEPDSNGKITINYDYLWKSQNRWFRLTGETYKDRVKVERNESASLSKKLGNLIPDIKRCGGNKDSKGRNTGFKKKSSALGGRMVWYIDEETIDYVITRLERKYTFDCNCFIQITKPPTDYSFLEDSDDELDSVNNMDELDEI